MKKNIDKIRGALFGVAVGDALGAPLEFMKPAEIKAKYGPNPVREMVGGGWLNVAPGEVTDDTDMTMAVAFGILDFPKFPIPAIGKNFIEWYNSKPKDIGATCAKSIELENEYGWKQAARIVAEENNGRSGGNGALMRTVYTGLYYDMDQLEAQTAAIAEMTHHDVISTHCCIDYAMMVHRSVKKYTKTADMRDYIRLWLDLNDMPINPSGWSKDSMNCALWSIAETNCFEDAVVRAVNLGGDADTIGAITGGLAGAIYGYKAIPERWIAALSEDIQLNMDLLAKAATANE